MSSQLSALSNQQSATEHRRRFSLMDADQEEAAANQRETRESKRSALSNQHLAKPSYRKGGEGTQRKKENSSCGSLLASGAEVLLKPAKLALWKRKVPRNDSDPSPSTSSGLGFQKEAKYRTSSADA
jgi:hypothetical protein